jgi:major vault protein
MREDFHQEQVAFGAMRQACAMQKRVANQDRHEDHIPEVIVTKKTRCVTLEIPHNSACQLYDYKNKNARVVFGPEMVVLQPDEQFTLLSLSAGKPKKPNQLRSLVLLLGPDFCTDTVEVETVDHARLRPVFDFIL